MEFNLRCNTLKCRKPLTERAVVTTCSHIFCVDCANNLNLAEAGLQHRQCPACKEALSNPDDAVTTVLRPSEDYKTSVLSGLDPNTIMECAGRALAFWTYQTTQEIFYHQFIGKNLSEKYGYLSSQMDKVVQEANSEIQNCQKKIEALSLDTKRLREQKAELTKQYQLKAQRCAQTQKLYDQLKSKYRMSGVSAAAVQSANMIAPTRPATYTQDPVVSIDGVGMRTPSTPLNPEVLHNNEVRGWKPSNSYHMASQSGSLRSPYMEAMPPPQRPMQNHGPYPRQATTPRHRSQLPGSLQTIDTTVGSRSQIPQSTAYFHVPGSSRSNPSMRSTPNGGSKHPGSAGYGLSAGMKISRAVAGGPSPGVNIASRSSLHNSSQFNGLPNNIRDDSLGGAFASGPGFPGRHFS